LNNFIENHIAPFANGQVGCDLRRKSDPAESETQFAAANVIEKRADVAPEGFPPPIGKLLGLRITSSGAGRAKIDFEAGGRYANLMGALHGGVLCDLGDAAMGVAYRSTLAEGDTFTTIELKINFLRPVWNANLRSEARVARAGKVAGLIQCDIFDEGQRLVAGLSSTSMTLQAPLAEGRQFGQSKENRERARQQRGSEFQPGQIDADERLPGYLSEPHLPRFESRRAHVLASSAFLKRPSLYPLDPRRLMRSTSKGHLRVTRQTSCHITEPG
jgi:uncharacterized protein (TIGR00369 family)